MGQLADWQQRAWQNKLKKQFNTTNVEREFNYTYAELAEAYEAYRKNLSEVGEELADVLIFLLSLAKMLDVDLDEAVESKLKKNEQRMYQQLGAHHVKKED